MKCLDQDREELNIMAKRFTDSEKWQDPWFSDLSASDKLLFLYLLDSCDHAGLWKINMKLASFQIGFEYSLETVIKQLGNRIKVVNDDYLFVPKFINFQYPNGLNPNWTSTKSVISKLMKYNLLETVTEQLPNSMVTPQDKDIDIDKVKDKVKTKSKTKVFLPPTLDEFVNYCVEKLPTINSEWTSDRSRRAATQRFETYVADNWKDGFGKQVKNWKTKAINSLQHQALYKFGAATSKTGKMTQEQIRNKHKL